MFIKVFVPNANGKIELTIKELEALIQEAVDKATTEKCSKCGRSWSWDGWNNNNRITTQPNITLLNGDLDSLRSPINGQLELDFD